MAQPAHTETSVEANKRRCLQMVAGWNRWELRGITEHWSPDIVHYSEDQPVDTDEMVGRMEAGLRAFPDLHLDVRSITGEGDRVVLRITVTATHRTPYLGVQPTGEKLTWHIVEELRFDGDKVIEHWDVMNYLPMLKQLGKVSADI